MDIDTRCLQEDVERKGGNKHVDIEASDRRKLVRERQVGGGTLVDIEARRAEEVAETGGRMRSTKCARDCSKSSI